MRKRAFSHLFAVMGVSFTLLFTACVEDKNLELPPLADQSFSEEFDTTSAAISRGWKIINVSDPKGSGLWQQGGDVVPWFSPWSSNGTYAGFIGASYTSTSAAAGDISNWVVSPPYMIQNGDKLTFYTRGLQYDDGSGTGEMTDYGNRLQVRINKSNTGTNVGFGAIPGDFTSLLLDINPTYLYSSKLNPVANAYPTGWTKFEVTVYGIEKPVEGRIGFRYFVQGGGSNGLGSGVGIDNVVYKSVGH